MAPSNPSRKAPASRKKPADAAEVAEKRRRSLDAYARFSGIGFQMAAAIFLGVWGGQKLDALWGTDPWLTVIGSLLGVGAALYAVFKELIPPSR